MIDAPVLTNLEAFQSHLYFIIKIVASFWVLTLVMFRITEGDDLTVRDAIGRGYFRPWLSFAIMSYVIWQMWV